MMENTNDWKQGKKKEKEEQPKTVIISRHFDLGSGSATWILAQKIYEQMDVARTKKVYKRFPVPNIVHDWLIIPLFCLWYRLCGYKDFLFMNENQTSPVILLNLTFANTKTFINDLMRLQVKKKSFDYYYFYLMYWLSTRSKTIMAISQKTASEVLDFYGEKLAKKIVLVPPYVDSFNPDWSKRRENIIGYLGALNHRKRVLKIIDLALEIKSQGLPYKIEVWGKGELEEELKNKVKVNFLSDIVTFKGYAPEEKKEKIHNSFGFFFFPTEKEGFGIPAFDSICCEVPVFIYSDADVPEEVRKDCIIIHNEKDMLDKINYIKKLNSPQPSKINLQEDPA